MGVPGLWREPDAGRLGGLADDLVLVEVPRLPLARVGGPAVPVLVPVVLVAAVTLVLLAKMASTPLCKAGDSSTVAAREGPQGAMQYGGTRRSSGGTEGSRSSGPGAIGSW
jgi:hypothetical protein